MNLSCPLCQTTNVKNIDVSLLKCSECLLVFKSTEVRISADEEKSRYGTHENTEDNPGYTDFLDRLRLPLLKFLIPDSHGLDYGCGPGPVLAQLLKRDGFKMQIYDPFFAPEKPAEKFDFITCTEAIEHFYSPKKEIEYMLTLLKPDGVLAFMTSTYNESTKFDSWWYFKDPTHVCFFHEKTFDWIAMQYKLSILVNHNNLCFFKVES